MAVTPIGWILLLAGPLLMMWRPRWLYLATLFFLPFTATGVINVGQGLEGSALQVSMYLGSLLILRHLSSLFSAGKLPFPRSNRWSLLWLAIFILATALSLVMPLWIDGHVMIPSGNLADISTHPLHLSGHNITGVLYMVYGFLFAYLIVLVTRREGMLHLTIKAFMVGSVFTCLWAVLEFVCKITDIPYPSVIFNTGTAASTMGYKEFLIGDVYRLSSVAVEPSVLAQTLLVSLCLYLPFVFGGAELFGKRLDRFQFALIVMVLCLTTSSTAYIGILLILMIVSCALVARGVLKVKHIFLPVSVLSVAVLLYFTVPIAQRVIDAALLSKSGSYSALERLTTVLDSYQMFLNYPVLGIGWTSITCHDLVVNILANAGIVGLVCFSAAMYFVFRALYRSIMSRSRRLGVHGLMRIDFACFIALTVTLVVCAISGFAYMFSFFWFVVGVAITASDVQLPERKLRRRIFLNPVLGARL